jgi:hypothetical protein
MMKLKYFPVNAAWAFVFGDAPCQLYCFPLFFETRREAVEAAEYRGLAVSAAGSVTVK